MTWPLIFYVLKFLSWIRFKFSEFEGYFLLLLPSSLISHWCYGTVLLMGLSLQAMEHIQCFQAFTAVLEKMTSQLYLIWYLVTVFFIYHQMIYGNTCNDLLLSEHNPFRKVSILCWKNQVNIMAVDALVLDDEGTMTAKNIDLMEGFIFRCLSLK